MNSEEISNELDIVIIDQQDLKTEFKLQGIDIICSQETQKKLIKL